MFTVYEASTGRIVATDRTETQAENIAAALRCYGRMNVTVASTADYEGGNVHDHNVRLDNV